MPRGWSSRTSEHIGRATKDEFVEADDNTLWDNRAATRNRLASFVGRTQEIDGRRYLRFEDYARWKGRSVKGKLHKEPGIVAASWNSWRTPQGPAAILADVSVVPLTCWDADAPFTVHEAEAASKLARERADLLRSCRRWTLHDDGRELHLFT